MLFRFPLCGIIVLLIVWSQFGPSCSCGTDDLTDE